MAIPACYNQIVTGAYVADLLAEERTLIELKTIKNIEYIYRTQCSYYLKATGFKLCLLISFGKPKLQIKRIVNNLTHVRAKDAED